MMPKCTVINVKSTNHTFMPLGKCVHCSEAVAFTCRFVTTSLHPVTVHRMCGDAPSFIPAAANFYLLSFYPDQSGWRAIDFTRFLKN